MNYRAKNIGIAVALAALAAILTSVYVVNYKRHVQHGEGKVTVLVAAHDIPSGTSGADIIDQHMLRKETVPRKAVVAGAISSPDQLSQYIATEDVFQGEQVSTRRFAPPREQGIRAQIKGTQRAYQLEGDSHQLLAGTLKAGDHVDVVATWGIKNPGQNNSDDAIVSRVAALMTGTETTQRERVRLFATGSCEGFDKLRESLASHPEIELVGASTDVAGGAAALAGGHLDAILHATRSATLPADELAAIR